MNRMKNSLINSLFWIQLINGNFQGYENSSWKFRDRNDIFRQVWNLMMHLDSLGTWMSPSDKFRHLKKIFWEFRDLNDISRQVRVPLMCFTLMIWYEQIYTPIWYEQTPPKSHLHFSTKFDIGQSPPGIFPTGQHNSLRIIVKDATDTVLIFLPLSSFIPLYPNQ